ncbi:MAG: GNAT family N-acetyltransferase [Firmicutes bacterium]|nr:GNAT family N-acetyltransferase [Bacillota bacterium]
MNNLGLMKADDFPKIYDIMVESFPTCEIRSYQKALQLLNNPNYKIIVIQDQQLKKISGFFAVWNLTSFNFIEHFAVRKDMRGLGIGSKAMKKYIHINSRPLVLEVEAFPTEEAKRRIKFYQRLGFVENELAYLQPPIEKGQARPPLKIMNCPSPIPKKNYKNIKAVLFSKIYGIEI